MLAEAVIGEILMTSRPGMTALVGEIPMSLSSLPRDFIPNLMSKVAKHANEYTETGDSSTYRQYVPFVSFRDRASFMRESQHTTWARIRRSWLNGLVLHGRMPTASAHDW